MYFHNLKTIRTKNKLTQQNIADVLKVKRSTYATWERGAGKIPLDKADELSLFYSTKLSYILGIESKIIINKNIKEINYTILLDNLLKLKNKNNDSYSTIANKINCGKTTCYEYFTGKTPIPIDRLIALSKYYNISIDKLCGKE